MGRRDDQAKLLEPRQALDHGRARQLGSPHEQTEADRHTAVRYTPASFDDGQIDLDRLAANPGQVATVEENGLYPVVLGDSGIATDMIGQLSLEEVSLAGDRPVGWFHVDLGTAHDACICHGLSDMAPGLVAPRCWRFPMIMGQPHEPLSTIDLSRSLHGNRKSLVAHEE